MVLCVILTDGQGFNAAVIHQKLTAADAWAKFHGGMTWLIVTSRSPAEWRDELKPYIGKGSALVIRTVQEWAGFKGEISEWLKASKEFF